MDKNTAFSHKANNQQFKHKIIQYQKSINLYFSSKRVLYNLIQVNILYKTVYAVYLCNFKSLKSIHCEFYIHILDFNHFKIV